MTANDVSMGEGATIQARALRSAAWRYVGTVLAVVLAKLASD